MDVKDPFLFFTFYAEGTKLLGSISAIHVRASLIETGSSTMVSAPLDLIEKLCEK